MLDGGYYRIIFGNKPLSTFLIAEHVKFLEFTIYYFWIDYCADGFITGNWIVIIVFGGKGTVFIIFKIACVGLPTSPEPFYVATIDYYLGERGMNVAVRLITSSV